MWEDEAEEARQRRIVWGVAVAVVIVLAAGAWYWFRIRQPGSGALAAARAPAAAPLPAAETEPPIAHPLGAAADAGGAALPALNDSDSLALESLADVIGHPAVERFLIPQNVVRHVVATIDNLPRHKLSVELRPLKPTPGAAVAGTQGNLLALGEEHFARYAPMMRVVQACDPAALAQAYQRLYPLFQQAYEDLGYPGKYFNDRLVEVIDHLLQTPEIPTPIQVVQPKVFFEYADPDLEARSSGQKLLMRMGTANERIIKGKLREFRAQIVKKS